MLKFSKLKGTAVVWSGWFILLTQVVSELFATFKYDPDVSQLTWSLSKKI